MSLRRLFAFVEVKTRNRDFSSTVGWGCLWTAYGDTHTTEVNSSSS